MIPKSALAVAAALALSSAPAWADTLVENVEGITLNEAGELERFTGLVIGCLLYTSPSPRDS